MQSQIIGSGKVVELSYQLFDESHNHQMIEQMTAEYPLQFLFGSGKMLPAFEFELEGLPAGAVFDFELAASRAYGAYQDDKLKQIFADELAENENYPFDLMQVGDRLQLLLDNEKYTGIVSLKTDRYFILDQNHFLAGKSLRFRGTVLFVRQAREQELIEGRYIPSDGLRF